MLPRSYVAALALLICSTLAACFQDAAAKAKDFAGERFAQAGDKLKELQSKDPKELIEDAKEFARQKPGQTILISAAIGMVLGFLLKGRK